MDINADVYISGCLRHIDCTDSDFIPDFSQKNHLGSRELNWKDIFSTSGIFDSGIFPLFSINGNIGSSDLLWGGVYAESGLFQKELFFKGFSAHMANVYCGHNGSTTLTINNTQQVVPINTDVVIDFSYTRSANTITILHSGLYKITAQCSVEIINTAGGARGKPRLSLQRNGVEIPGAVCLAGLEETSSIDACNLNIFFIDGLVPSNEIRMTIQDLASSEPNEQVPSGSARLLIERIR